MDGALEYSLLNPAVLLPTMLFYALAGVLLLSALMVITARNPVHSVLFLILAFFNAAGLFLLQGAEFVAMVLVIVYVGAVAVLFLFVVMMLDVDFASLRKGMSKHLPLGLMVGGVILAEFGLVLLSWPHNVFAAGNGASPMPTQVTNSEALGLILYTDYIVPFQAAGLVLLVAMIGAIVLTLRTRKDVRRQKPFDQIARKASDVLRIHKTGSGS